MTDRPQHLHFVTGRLAEPSLRALLEDLAPAAGFDYSIDVLGITVAALMTCSWVASRVRPPQATTQVLLPGYCQGDLDEIAARCGCPVLRGPKDLRELPEFLGQARHPVRPLDEFEIEILAELNHAPRLPLAELVRQAEQLAAQGADVIDLGCDPGGLWHNVGDAVRALVERGLRVSIDSLEPLEIAPAVRAGAQLVLSVTSANRHAAADWGAEVVAIPDTPGDERSLAETVEWLAARGVPFRIDPILEPIGFGFAESLARYRAARQRWPEAPLLMGIGNLTELTDVDSAGINVLLLAICQEWAVGSVLTTQVINWCRTSVRECDLARRLVYRSLSERCLPKHLEPRLVALRDPVCTEMSAAQREELSRRIRDPNYRIFAAADGLALVSAGLHLVDADPYDLFAKLLAQKPANLDPEHAFYLGFELAKAHTARTLGKQYRQDEALNWGYLTRAEPTLRHRRLAAAERADDAEAS